MRGVGALRTLFLLMYATMLQSWLPNFIASTHSTNSPTHVCHSMCRLMAVRLKWCMREWWPDYTCN